MELVGNVADLDTVAVATCSDNPPEFQPNDQLCEAAMNVSKRPKEMYLNIKTSDGYVYNPPANLLCNFKTIRIKKAKWVTRDVFIKSLLHCTHVRLTDYNFSDEDLAAILREWSLNSSMQYMEVNKRDGSNRQKTLTDVVENLPDAVPVEKAAIYVIGMVGARRDQFKRVSFSEARSYRVKGSDGKNYLIFYINDYLYLTTNFEEIVTEDILPNIESDEITWRD